MRRRDRRRTWGLWGDFLPIADRDMRIEVNEREGSVDADEDRFELLVGAFVRARDGLDCGRGADAFGIAAGSLRETGV